MNYTKRHKEYLETIRQGRFLKLKLQNFKCRKAFGSGS